MKIQWNFADVTTSEVEVDEELGTFITASRREEDNLSRKERYHCYSLDAILFEGKEYGDNHTPETEVETAERNKRLYAAMKTLTAVQQRRLLMEMGYYGLSPATWSEDISAGKTTVKNWPFHITELRKAIEPVITAVNGFDSSSSFDIPPVTWLPIGAGRPKADVMQQIQNLILTL